MSNCTQQSFSFPALKRRKIEVEFSGGVLLLRGVDKKPGLLQAIDQVLTDPRDQDQIKHSQLSLLSQRVYSLCLGYEDLNDHQQLRLDPALQTAVNRDEVLASQSTLCRLENRMNRQTMIDIHQVFLDQFIASFDAPPEELILDFDATDDPTHGCQEKTFYHGYYRHYCFLPLYVFLQRSITR